MSKPRILVFAMNFSGNKIAGVESAIYDEYVELSKKMNLIVLAKNAHDNLLENIKIIRVPRNHPPYWTLKNTLSFTRKMLKVRNDFDVVYTRLMGYHLLIPAIIAKIFFRKKFVMFISGSMKVLPVKENWLNRPVIKIALRLADKICNHSQASLEDLELHVGKRISRQKIIFLNHFVDSNKFRPDNSIQKKNHVICTGRIDPIGNFEALIESIPHIVKEIPELKIKIIGPAVDKIQKIYLKKLNELIKTMKVEKHIEFTGSVPRECLVEWYNSALIFVSTKKAVGISTSIVEAMSCELPVITTGKGSLPQSDNNLKNGILVEENPRKISENIIKLLQNEELRKQIGREARKTVIAKYDKDYFIGKLEQVLNQIAK